MNECAHIAVRPYRRWHWALDAALTPCMYLLAGTRKEPPQGTHWWNHHALSREEVKSLDARCFVTERGLLGEKPAWRFGIPLVHAPVFGGWHKYVVLAPDQYPATWHIGWLWETSHGQVKGRVSKVPLRTPVRMLRGPGLVCFFGLNHDGQQMLIRTIGYGRVGELGPYSSLPLL
jgi:hypothetical protein